MVSLYDFHPVEDIISNVAHVIVPKKEFKVTVRPRPKPKPTVKKPSKGGVTHEDPPARKTDTDKKNKSDADSNKMDNWKKAAAAAGVAAVVVGAVALAVVPNLIKCDNATMTITDIHPTGFTSNTADNGGLSALLGAVQQAFAGRPTTVDVTYTINNDYKINEGKDQVDFNGTGTILDGGDPVTIEKVVGTNTIRVSCGMSDCSNVVSQTGTGEPRCSFEDAVNTELYNATKNAFNIATDGLSSIFSGIMPLIGPIVIGIIGVILLFMGLPLLFSLFSKGKSNNNKG